jgi:hypothetical protein
MSTKIKWAIWSGEGEVGGKKIKTATLQGIKRILTQERCGGDRFAHACPAHWPEAQFCSSARECDIDNLTEADIERMHAGQALGSIKSPKKSASSRENGKLGGRPAVDGFNEKFPIAQDFHTGLWGWRRINGSVDLSKCAFKSRAAASRDRNQSNEKALFSRTGEICISE